MKKINLEITLTYDEELFGDSEEEKDWLYNDILLKEEYILHSNEIGDEIGTLKVNKVYE